MSEYKVFDQIAALDRVDSDKELLCELVDMFKKTYQENLKNLESAINNHDLDSIIRTSHMMKGSLGNLGGMTAFSLAQKIEACGKSDNLTEIGTLFQNFRLEIDKFFKEFECFKNGQWPGD